MKALLYIKNAWLVFGITIILVFGVELVSYVLVSIRYLGIPIDSRSQADGYGNDATWAEAYFKELYSMPGFKWHPYVYWRRIPFKGNYTSIDEQGLRRTWSAIEEGRSKSESLRIFMFGGSAMWGTGARDEETIPSILAKLLTQDYGFNVKMTNFGASGYVTTQEAIALLRELQRGNMPDLVIFYDGVNDTFSTSQNRGLGGVPQNESNREREFNLVHPSQIRRLYKETLLVTFKNSSTYQVLRSLARRTTGRDLLRLEQEPHVSTSPNQIARETARVYAWNMKLVKKLGDIYGFRALFYWQPIVSSKKTLTSYEQQIKEGMEEIEMDHVEAVKEVKARLSDTDMFHDLRGVFAGDGRPYFIDPVHVTGAGNEIIVRRMLRDVAPIAQKLMAKRRESKR